MNILCAKKCLSFIGTTVIFSVICSNAFSKNYRTSAVKGSDETEELCETEGSDEAEDPMK